MTFINRSTSFNYTVDYDVRIISNVQNSIMDFITEKDRIYATDSSGKIIAEVTFPTEDGVSTIDHTFVDPSLRGQGVAGKLVKLAADHILAEGNRIAAICSYAVAWFKRHPEYSLVCSGPVACRIDRRK